MRSTRRPSNAAVSVARGPESSILRSLNVGDADSPRETVRSAPPAGTQVGPGAVGARPGPILRHEEPLVLIVRAAVPLEAMMPGPDPRTDRNGESGLFQQLPLRSLQEALPGPQPAPRRDPPAVVQNIRPLQQEQSEVVADHQDPRRRTSTRGNSVPDGQRGPPRPPRSASRSTSQSAMAPRTSPGRRWEATGRFPWERSARSARNQ